MTEKEQLMQHAQQLKDTQLNTFVITALAKAPKEFWTIAASSTGKHHPEQSNGKGGLVRHILATLYFARELFIAFNTGEADQDAVNAALIMHDFGKAMHEPHDIVAATDLRWLQKDLGYQDNAIITAALDGVRWHMGKWSTGSTHCAPDERGTKQFPKDFSYVAQLVHLADYAASRKRVNLTKLGVTE